MWWRLGCSCCSVALQAFRNLRDATNQVAASGGGWVYGRSLTSVLVNPHHMGQPDFIYSPSLPIPFRKGRVVGSPERHGYFPETRVPEPDARNLEATICDCRAAPRSGAKRGECERATGVVDADYCNSHEPESTRPVATSTEGDWPKRWHLVIGRNRKPTGTVWEFGAEP